MGSNRSWDGTFDSSKEADRSVEEALLDIMEGNEIGKATDDGGLIKSKRRRKLGNVWTIRRT